VSASIAVIGGAYAEECAFPARQMFRGSGGRAAAILTSLGAQVLLSTVTGPRLTSIFRDIATRLGYQLDAQAGSQDIWFRYQHPLASPTVFPPEIAQVSYASPIKADRALVFGMIEGRLPICAKRAVYDPQDGIAAKTFGENGSTADELAFVLSHSEGRALTGENDPATIASKLLAQQGVSVVIVKCGPQGALVRTANSLGWVRPFPTQRVYKIGSGDAFSAAFAYAWLVEEQEPVSAAWFASRVAAAYVESGQDRFSPDEIGDFRAQAGLAHRRHGLSPERKVPDTQIYLAGPFFSTSQQWLVDEARGALKDMGFRVFSPIHDVGAGPWEEVAPADIAALESSGIMLALLDGVDAGTMFEVGYARAKKIPVVAIAEAVDATPLTMVLGSGCVVTNDFTTGVFAVCWQLMGDV
jgi:nucleoside 2-deoxyribosyltransferase